MKVYWYKNCIVCKNGRLIVRKIVDNNLMCIWCEECECLWFEINEIVAGKNYNLFDYDYILQFPDYEEIKMKWPEEIFEEGIL